MTWYKHNILHSVLFTHSPRSTLIPATLHHHFSIFSHKPSSQSETTPMSRPFFRRRDKVEVTMPGRGSTGPYFPATVLRYPSKSSPQTLDKMLVEYRAPRLSDASETLRERVEPCRVRPPPPPEPSRCFKSGDQVDAFLRDAWFRGTVAGILEGSRYSVLLAHEAEREIVRDHFNLRLHRDWDSDQGSWVPPLQDEAEPSTRVVKDRSLRLKFVVGKKQFEAKFESGTIVEVTSEEDGYKESWYAAKIIGSMRTDKFLVEYQDLVTEDGMQLLREEAETRHVRPVPPLLPPVPYFEKLQKVDAWYNDGWWEGVISKLQPGGLYVVYFRSTNEELIFKHSELRPHQDWINGKWMIATKENSSKRVVSLHCADLQSEENRPNCFSKGMQVEVRSDEEGYRGSWYVAKIVAPLANDKFLVEYQTLKTDDETEFLKEEAYAKDTRPCPPEIRRVYPFVLCENVDAWYNDGWWAGRVSKALAGRKYMVYFSTTNEELEFDHYHLRPHQEWKDGKWIYSPMP